MLDNTMDTQRALAFAALSASSERNLLYAEAARKKGNVARARLLTAIARSESTQARRLLMSLRGKIEDPDVYFSNLTDAKQAVFGSSGPRLHEAYTAAGDRYGAEFFDRLTRVSRNHHGLLKRQASGTGVPAELYTCRICGFIASDRVPDKCPVCNAVPERFEMISQ